MIPFLPLFPAIFLMQEIEGKLSFFLSYALIGLSAFLFLFVFWRLYRLARAGAIRSGRRFERNDRKFYPPDYKDAEDAILAKRRRKASSKPSK
jgi:hypothetical protein